MSKTTHQPIARTLQPRHSVTGYFDLDRMVPEIQKAYVRTDCEEVAYGISPALKQIRRGCA